jgi:hypothetical protein
MCFFIIYEKGLKDGLCYKKQDISPVLSLKESDAY